MRHSTRVVNGYKAKLLSRVRALNPTLANDISELKLPWYYIKNAESPVEEGAGSPKTTDDKSSDTAEIFIYDEIGGSFGVDANEFVQDLQGIKSENITVRINSPGGSVFDAIAIYNALVQHPANVTTRVDALAASAASIIAMAGDKVEMMVGSQLMVHDAMGTEMGNAKEMREMAAFLDLQSQNLASIYAAKGGGDPQEWRALMLKETWMFAQEAVDLGLADSVYTRSVKKSMEQAAADGELDPENLPPMNEGDKPGTDPSKEEDDKEEEPPTEDELDEEIEDFLENLMSTRHRTTNRGWKYTGRDKAPEPIVNNKLDDVFSNYLSKL